MAKAKAKALEPWTDLTHAADDEIAPFAFVEVTDGDDTGKYGVVIDRTPDGQAIVRTRDENNELIVVPFDALANSQAGRRPS